MFNIDKEDRFLVIESLKKSEGAVISVGQIANKSICSCIHLNNDEIKTLIEKLLGIISYE